MSEDQSPRDPQHPNVDRDRLADRDQAEGAGEVTRRTLFRLGALAGAGASVAGAGVLKGSAAWAQETPDAAPTIEEIDAAVASAPSELNEATIAELQQMMSKGHLSATE